MFTKILTSSLLFLIAIGGFFVSNSVIYANQVGTYNQPGAIPGQSGISSANNSTSTTTVKSESDGEWLKKSIQAFNALLGVLTIIVSPAIIFAGWLLSPDWTSGDMFGLREPMHKIWVVVSNIVYFVYAILLIIIAVATILGKENFNYKVMLPKLALGILMVPFTWWFVQWTISLSTIVTASTVSIPMDMITENNPYINGNYIPRYFLTTNDPDNNTTSTDYAQNCDGSTLGAGNRDCTNIQEMLGTGGGIYSPLLIYAYQIFRIQDYKSISSTLEKVKTAGQLLNNVIIGAVMFVVFGILVMALIAILFIRAIKLWMYAMFSPLFTLHFVAGKELFKDAESFSLKEFVGLCFIPAIVGITLSFGLMVLSIIQSPNQSSGQETCTQSQFEIRVNNINELRNTTQGCEVIGKLGSFRRGLWIRESEQWAVNIIDVAGVKYIYTGKATNASDMRQSINNITGGLSAAGGIFGTIVVDVIALIFIWMAFMAAKGLNKTLEKVVFQPLGQIGERAASMPKYIPLPIPGGSIDGASRAAKELGNIPEMAAKKRYDDSRIGKFIKERTGAAGTEEISKVRQAIEHYPDKLKEAFGNTTNDSFKNGIRQEIASKSDKLIEQIKKPNSGYSESQKRELEKLIKELKEKGDSFPEGDLYRLRAILAGAESTITAAEAKEGGKTKGKNPSGADKESAANEVTTKVNDTTFNLNNITDEVIQVNTTDNGKKVILDQKDIEKIKNKTGTMSEATFRDGLLKSGKWTEEGINDLILKIKSANEKFFKEEEPKK